MKSIAEFLLSFVAFREALESLGWKPPTVEPNGGGGHAEE
jgi:hypothetical protein